MSEVIIEQIEHDGEIYFRIDPATIDLDAMEQALKVTDIMAFQVKNGHEQDVVTQSGGVEETINHANVGDWIVYNIGNAEGETLQERVSTADVKVIREEDFPKLYEKIDINEDDSTYSDYDRFFKGAAFQKVALYHYIGKPVFVARVPFNFCIHATWGKDQFIKAGGFLVYNPNTSTQAHHDIYGTQGAHHRKAGQFEKTYAKITDDLLDEIDSIEDTYKNVIKADRSPIAGIQFNMPDLQRAYNRLGRDWEKEVNI